jgi:hypothetical protein
MENKPNKTRGNGFISVTSSGKGRQHIKYICLNNFFGGVTLVNYA